MTKLTLTSETTNVDGSKTTVTVSTDAAGLHQILQEFECFLRGCGFYFDGSIDIVFDEPEVPDTLDPVVRSFGEREEGA